MSDTFNHVCDAYDSMGFDYYYEDNLSFSNNQNDSEFVYDPLFYHTLYKFKKLEKETDKAYCFKHKKQYVWIPKRLCKHLQIVKNKDGKERCHVYIWKYTTMQWKLHI